MVVDVGKDPVAVASVPIVLVGRLVLVLPFCGAASEKRGAEPLVSKQGSLKTVTVRRISRRASLSELPLICPDLEQSRMDGPSGR